MKDMLTRIYLDNNATTAMDPRVIEVISRVSARGPLNASSQHALGREARALVDDAIESIGRSLGTRLNSPGGARLILTSGGTEANNMAFWGLGDPDSPVVLSRIEHPSVLAVAERMSNRGREVRWLDVDSLGIAKVDELEEIIDPSESKMGKAGLVSIMSANNETGVVQPIERAAEICRKKNILFHVDATQSIGKLPISLSGLGASAVTFSAHKFHGPAGIGGLWLNEGVSVKPLLYGGEQQLESRPGTEPVALICGMAEAIQIATRELSQNVHVMAAARDHLEVELCSQHTSILFHGPKHAFADGLPTRLPNTSCVSFLGADRQSMLMALDLAGLCCSSGSACSSGSSPPSHVLLAMGLGLDAVKSAIRFGTSKFSTDEEIQWASSRISMCYKRLHA